MRNEMAAGAGRWISSPRSFMSRYIRQPEFSCFRISIPRASSRRDELPMVPKKKTRPRLITISSSDGRWQGKWDCDYRFSLQDLQLNDLLPADEVQEDTDVYISLHIKKLAGLGVSVEGRIRTSFTRNCCICCSPYLREIDTPLKVWILPSTRQSKDPSKRLPEIGGDDPSVIYVKPGYEADLDPLIQETTRLAISVNETCSESCERSEPELHNFGPKNTASIDKRWYKLLELKDKIRTGDN